MFEYGAKELGELLPTMLLQPLTSVAAKISRDSATFGEDS